MTPLIITIIIADLLAFVTGACAGLTLAFFALEYWQVRCIIREVLP